MILKNTSMYVNLKNKTQVSLICAFSFSSVIDFFLITFFVLMLSLFVSCWLHPCNDNFSGACIAYKLVPTSGGFVRFRLNLIFGKNSQYITLHGTYLVLSPFVIGLISAFKDYLFFYQMSHLLSTESFSSCWWWLPRSIILLTVFCETLLTYVNLEVEEKNAM